MASGCVSKSFYRDLLWANKMRRQDQMRYAVYAHKKNGDLYKQPCELYRTLEQATEGVERRVRLSPGSTWTVQEITK